MSEATMQTEYFPTSVSPPGETLGELLEERGISQTELAERTGRPRKTINEILQGKAALTPETALQLELVLGVPARFWNAREAHYREHLARKEERARLARLGEWAEPFPYKEMANLGWVPHVGRVEEKVRALLEFFGVTSPEQWATIQTRTVVSFRKSVAFEANAHALAAWLRRGEREAERAAAEPYEEKTFRSALNRIRALTRSKPEVFDEQLRHACIQAGVVVAFVPQLKGSRAHGATRWVSPDRALIQLSLRYKTEDHLWFTFFHEAAHILFHRKRDIYLESSAHEGREEAEANRFAADFLIPREAFAHLVTLRAYSKNAIRAFASEIGISPGIVVGRLQYEGLLPFTHCNDLKIRLKWTPAEQVA